MGFAAVLFVLDILAVPPAATAQGGVPVFNAPSIAAREQRALAALRAGDAEASHRLLETLVSEAPGVPHLHALHALVLAETGADDAAVAALNQALESGFRELDNLLRAPAFDRLRNDPRIAALPAPAPPPPAAEPAAVTNRSAPIGPDNTQWNRQTGLFEALLDFPQQPSRDRGPATAPDDSERAFELLASLRRRGLASGHRGDVYDNRDHSHSRLATNRFPQIDITEYAPEAKKAGLDYGLNDRLMLTATVIGNSSTAITTGTLERSLPRAGMTWPGAAMRIARLYGSNHLYVYPAHLDYGTLRGDVFPASMPSVVATEGSSGSDRSILTALALALAALRPDTKSRLREAGLIAPTLQMLLRRTLKPQREAYLSASAHPTAFDGTKIDRYALVLAANALMPDTIPPVPLIRLERSDGETGGIALFGDGLSENLFTTPYAIARVARGLGGTRRYVLDAGQTADPNGRALQFEWRLLRGDPDRVTIAPLDAAGRRVAVTIPWHERGTVPGRPDLSSDRVEIALFADNGVHLSAPAFFSLYFPTRQLRRYDASGHLLEVDFANRDRMRRYEDVSLVPHRGWRDEFDYTEDGTLLGWTRYRGDSEIRYTRHGAKVIQTDDAGRPIVAQPVSYPVVRDDDGGLLVHETASGDPIYYRYDGPADRLGFLDVPEPQ